MHTYFSAIPPEPVEAQPLSDLVHVLACTNRRDVAIRHLRSWRMPEHLLQFALWELERAPRGWEQVAKVLEPQVCESNDSGWRRISRFPRRSTFTSVSAGLPGRAVT